MKRKITDDLLAWINKKRRLPLILRGARQVGKTWIVRDFARRARKQLIELNFEDDKSLKTLFESNDPKKIIINLESFFTIKINIEKSLLFLDEIQAAPELLSKLRWFAEKMPKLAVIAAGSLLEFALEENELSLPVGRVSFMYLEPMSFEEFLKAMGKDKLCEFLKNYQIDEKIPQAIHELLLQFVKDYIIIGGLPAVVRDWSENKSLISVNEVQQSLLQTYRHDFAKYSGRVPYERLEELFKAVPRLIGKKFKYNQVNSEVQSISIKKALSLICKAKISHKIKCVHGNGLPLGAEIKENVFKVIFLDAGLVSSLLGLSLYNVVALQKMQLNNTGEIAEQLVGQLLRTIQPKYIEPDLYYWMREKTGSSAKIDYLIQSGNKITPVEVKAGKVGSLRSLHFFMELKKLKTALRINADYPSITNLNYKLISIPFYLIEQIPRLI